MSHQCAWLVGAGPCGRRFVSFDKLITHLGDEHDAKGYSHRKLVCHWLTRMGPCKKDCRRHGIRRHIATHLKLSVDCDHCEKSYSRADTLRAHIKKKHAGASLPTAGL